jgi:aspartyl aminopeptidase
VRDPAHVLAFVPWLMHIQVDRNVNDKFTFNQETEFVPILGQIADKFNEDNANKQTALASNIQGNHHPALLSLLAEELSVSPEEIHDFEL